MIQQLKKFEAMMLKKYEERNYESDTQFKDDIVKFLKDLETQEEKIKTNKEFAWVLAAISRWTHYLSIRFDVFMSVKPPDLRNLPDLQEAEDVIEKREAVLGSGGNRLGDLSENFEKLYQRINYIEQGQADISKQIEEHHYDMYKQHVEQTSKILDASGKLYSVEETRAKIASTAYPKLAGTG